MIVTLFRMPVHIDRREISYQEYSGFRQIVPPDIGNFGPVRLLYLSDCIEPERGYEILRQERLDQGGSRWRPDPPFPERGPRDYHLEVTMVPPELMIVAYWIQQDGNIYLTTELTLVRSSVIPDYFWAHPKILREILVALYEGNRAFVDRVQNEWILKHIR